MFKHFQRQRPVAKVAPSLQSLPRPKSPLGAIMAALTRWSTAPKAVGMSGNTGIWGAWKLFETMPGACQEANGRVGHHRHRHRRRRRHHHHHPWVIPKLEGFEKVAWAWTLQWPGSQICHKNRRTSNIGTLRPNLLHTPTTNEFTTLRCFWPCWDESPTSLHHSQYPPLMFQLDCVVTIPRVRCCT